MFVKNLKMDIPGQSCTIMLKDQVADKTYSIYLNKQDYDRALEGLYIVCVFCYCTYLYFGALLILHLCISIDDEFASLLLEHAKRIEGDISATEDPTADTIPDDSQLAEENKSDKWSYDATLCLIASMHNYVEDFRHPKSENLFGIMSVTKYKVKSVSENSCKNKFKSLERTYKSNKDKNLRGILYP